MSYSLPFLQMYICLLSNARMFIVISFVDSNLLRSLNEAEDLIPAQSKSSSYLLSLLILLGWLSISFHFRAVITAHLKHSRSEFFGFIMAPFLANQSGRGYIARSSS